MNKDNVLNLDNLSNEHEYSLRDLEKLGETNPKISGNIINEIFRRLNHNYLEDILNKGFFENLNWEYKILSSNPNISIKNVLANPNKKWDFSSLTENPNITVSDLINQNFPLDTKVIYKNPNITFTSIVDNMRINRIDEEIPPNPRIKFKDVIDNPKLKWNLTEVTLNSNVTMKDIIDNPKIPYKTMGIFDYRKLNITWDIDNLFLNPNITIKDYLNNSIFNWNVSKLAYNPNVNFSEIMRYGTIHNIESFEMIPNIDIRDVLNNKNIKWSFKNLSLNPNITLENVLINFDKEWSYDLLLTNPSIGVSEAIRYLTKYTNNPEWLSLNPSLTNKDILDNPQIKWDFSAIARNKFTKDPDYILIATKIIQKLLNKTSIPIYINDKLNILSSEQIYGLILGLDVTDKLNMIKIRLFDMKLNVDNAKILFATPIRDTKYLIYIKDIPYHFSTTNFISGLKTAKFRFDKIYDKDLNYTEITIQ